MSFATQDAANAAYVSAAREALHVNPEIQGQLNAIKTAEYRYYQLQHVGSTVNVNDAKNTLHRSESRYSSTLAQVTGVSVKEIDEMHSSGMTWGQVSHEIGVRVNDMVDSEFGTQGAMFSGNQQRENSTASSVGIDKLRSRGGQGLPQTESMAPEYPQNYNPSKQMQEMGFNSQEMTAATERNLFSGGFSGHGTDIQSTSIHRGATGSMSGAGGLGNGKGYVSSKGYVSINEAMSNPDEPGSYYGEVGGGRGGMH